MSMMGERPGGKLGKIASHTWGALPALATVA